MLQFEDLTRLSPDHLGRVCEWLTEKVDALCAQLKPDSKAGQAFICLHLDNSSATSSVLQNMITSL